MATRFGSHSSFYSYQKKLHLIVGSISLLILVLSGTIIFLLWQEDTPPAVAAERNSTDNPAAVNAVSGIEVLVAAQRVESGSVLRDDYFKTASLSNAELPSGVILAKDRSMLSDYYASRMIIPGAILHHDDITRERPPIAIDIPPGYRASTIIADAQQLAAGLITPQSRVDILFSYTNELGRRMTSTLVQFAKVISINGMTEKNEKINISSQPIPVSLLVTEMDAKRIELARNYGKLTLVLLGSTSVPTVGAGSDPVDLNSIINPHPEKETKAAEEPEYPGTMIVNDPLSGKQLVYKLTHKGWKRMPQI